MAEKTKRELTYDEIQYLQELYDKEIDGNGFCYFDKSDVDKLKSDEKLQHFFFSDEFTKFVNSEGGVATRKQFANAIASGDSLLKNDEFCVFNPSKIVIKRIKNLSQFVNEVSAVHEKNKVLFCRGQSNFKWFVQSSLFRDEKFQDKESELIYKMLRYRPYEFISLNEFDMLAKMQHYSLPTRLLDITENPLVALYFACQDCDQNDGRVFFYNVDESAIKYSGQDEIVNIAKKLLNKTYSDENEFLFVRANFTNERIINQSGSFILPLTVKFPKKLNTESKITLLIDRNSKKKILEDLKSFDIYDATMFREIDKVANYISKEVNKIV